MPQGPGTYGSKRGRPKKYQSRGLVQAEAPPQAEEAPPLEGITSRPEGAIDIQAGNVDRPTLRDFSIEAGEEDIPTFEQDVIRKLKARDEADIIADIEAQPKSKRKKKKKKKKMGGGMIKYNKGGKVRGAGIARGVRPAKMIRMKGS